MERYLLKNIGIPNSHKIEVYIKNEGYKALPKALDLKPQEIIEMVKKSGLRGRGGAGFPTGMKWGFAATDPNKPKYLLCNADEGEPGTFKDRPILEQDPHLLIEGMVISAYAIGAEKGYIYIRGEYPKAAQILEGAVDEAYKKGYLGRNILHKGFNFDLHVHKGAGAYICGEETALIESIEGDRGHPRVKPPFPANVGVWGKPTVVNNVETLANVPWIVFKGSDWFASIGGSGGTGPKLYCVSGHVNKPGVYELPMGITLRELIYEHGGGVRGNRKIKAIIPGGISAPVLTPDTLDVKMDFDSVAKAGSMLGSAAVIVMDETTCMVKIAWRAMKFFEHESCGKCTPCREGTTWLSKILERIEKGAGREEDIDLMLDICDNIKGKTLCPLGDGATGPVLSTIKNFREEYDAHIREARCPMKI